VSVLLDVRSIEVVYSHVILVLREVSLQVPEGGIVALLGGNGAGKTTTLRAISSLLAGERGTVTQGSIWLRGARIENSRASALVRHGLVQVMEGRHCFGHLTIEENLLTGAWTRTDGDAAIAKTLEKVYAYFPRLKTRRDSRAAYTSGGEQQMCAIGRALMANPRLVLLDEPSMGLAPQLVAEVFGIVRELNRQEGVSFLIAEQNSHMALEHASWAYVLESGRVVLEGRACELAQNKDVQEFYLGTSDGVRRSFRPVSSEAQRLGAQ
jgi:branched-chain amino acid transport system ATP-binding protein